MPPNLAREVDERRQWIKSIERVQFSASPFHHTGHHVGRKLDLVNLSHFGTLVSKQRIRIEGPVSSCQTETAGAQEWELCIDFEF